MQEISQIQWLTSSFVLEHQLQHECTIYCHNFSTNVTKNWSLCISRRARLEHSIYKRENIQYNWMVINEKSISDVGASGFAFFLACKNFAFNPTCVHFHKIFFNF